MSFNVSKADKQKIRAMVKDVLSKRDRTEAANRGEYMRNHSARKRAAEKSQGMCEPEEVSKARADRCTTHFYGCACMERRTLKMERALQAIQGYAETWAKEHAYTEAEYLFMSIARQCEEVMKA